MAGIYGTVLVTEHAAQRFVQRIDPSLLLLDEAEAQILALCATAVLSERETYRGSVVWWCEQACCWLVTRVDPGHVTVIVTVLDEHAQIGMNPRRGVVHELDLLALETAVRSGGVPRLEEAAP